MHLDRVDDLSAEVDELAERYAGRVGLTPVLADLDRRLRPTWAPCLNPHRAWTWDRADNRDRQWWPQGVSPAPGGRFVAVSWYAKDGGSRVTFADLRRRRYRHVELVRPTSPTDPAADTADGTGYEPLRIHAGGLVWEGRRLYVAATRAGLWVADTDDVLRTPHGSPTRYVLPVRHRLAPTRQAGGQDREPFRFSFVSLDRAGEQLVVGEYGSSRQTHRVAHIPLPPDADPTGPVTDTATALVTEHGVVRAQGIALAHGTSYATASHGPWTPGSLWSGQPGSMRERRYAVPIGPEDLAYDHIHDALWTVTEHPHRRWLLRLQRSSAGE